ncbi:MAG: acyl-CoA dehydrogenase family protein, partial [Isosphaeraceae bacterium]
MAWDFGYTKEAEAYRQKVATFLDKELTEEIARQNWEDLGLGEEGQAFGKKLYEAGLLGWSWPVEY